MPRLIDEIETLVDQGFETFADLNKAQQGYLLQLAIAEDINVSQDLIYLIAEYLTNPCDDTQSDLMNRFSELDKDYYVRVIDKLMANTAQRWFSEEATQLNSADDYCTEMHETGGW